MSSSATTRMNLPKDMSLPFFAYGAFKPGELAHAQICNYLSAEPCPVSTKGDLKVRDGLPLFDPNGSGDVYGYLLNFSAEARTQAYERICAFEPKDIYCWSEVRVQTSCANILLGKKMKRGRPAILESSEWTFRDDPVFKYGLETVRELANELAASPFESAPPHCFDWPRFFRLQMAYLLLWSAIERFSAFAYGPSLDPMMKVKAFGKDPRFLAALARQDTRPVQEVSDSRDPDDRARLDSELPEKAAEFYYQIRSNLSHSGKGAYSDGEIVRESLVQLLAIFEDMIHAT